MYYQSRGTSEEDAADEFGVTPPQTQTPKKRQKKMTKTKESDPAGKGGGGGRYVGLFRLFDLFEIISKVDFNF